MLTVANVQKLLSDYFPDGEIKVVDLTGTSDHFGVDVTSTQFEGLSLIKQHKLVHAAVGDHLTDAIHALDIKTHTP
ncbi:MAG: stress-induced morphogen [Planctomycetota bacterium]|jgi:stress-induced morphogen